MAQLISSPADLWTAQDLVLRFGPIPLNRIVIDPAPGTATIEDVVRLDDHEDRLCELIDGTLLEKTAGAYESLLAVKLISLLYAFVDAHNLGIVLGEAGMLQLFPDQVRIPDVSFVSHERLKGSGFPDEAAPLLAPDLVSRLLAVVTPVKRCSANCKNTLPLVFAWSGISIPKLAGCSITVRLIVSSS